MSHTAPTYTDTHAHFDAATAVAVLVRARQVGVTRIVAVGGTPTLNAGALAAQQSAPQQVRLALGLGRAETAVDAAELALFAASCQNAAICAIGEIGLDFHYATPTPANQIDTFEKLLTLADQLTKPVIIHTRDADAATAAAIDTAGSPALAAAERLGVVHCFTGSLEFARQMLDRGLHISFSGIVTFRNADALRAVAAYVPADRLLIETDSPWLAPVPQRGHTNEPAFVTHVAACLAQVRHTTINEIAAITNRNAAHLFGPWQ